MSNKRLTAVWENSKQKGTKLLTLLSLADRADDDGFCWPSLNDTAKRARTSRSYAVDIIREIEADGELFIHDRPGFTHQYLVIVGMTAQEIQKALMKRFGMTLQEAQKGVSDLQTRQAGWVLTLQEGGVSDLQTGGVNFTGHEPTVNPKNNPKIEISFGVCACCKQEFETKSLFGKSHAGVSFLSCANCDLRGQLPADIPRPEDVHKARISAALQNGAVVQMDMIARVRTALRLNLEKATKNNLDFLDFLKTKDREGMPIEKFAGYWTTKHWAGIKGQVPTINQVVENWYAAFDSQAAVMEVAHDGSFYV